MELHIVCSFDVFNGHHSVSSAVEFLESHVHQLSPSVVEISTNSSQEFIIVYFAVIVFVKILEHSFKLRWTEVVTVLFKAPHEFISVESFVPVVVHSSKDNAKSSDSVRSSRFQHRENFLDNLIRRFSGHPENRVHIWVIPTSFLGHEARELFKVQLAIVVGVVLSEQSVHFVVFK